MATPNNTISPGLHPPGQQLNANEEEEEIFKSYKRLEERALGVTVAHKIDAKTRAYDGRARGAANRQGPPKRRREPGWGGGKGQ